MPVSIYRDAYPKKDKIADAIAMYIRINGGPDCELRCDTVYGPLADHFGLSPVARALSRADYYGKSDDKRSAWTNLVQWARQKLNADGCLDRSDNGVWKLSRQGISFADGLMARHGRGAGKTETGGRQQREQEQRDRSNKNAVSGMAVAARKLR